MNVTRILLGMDVALKSREILLITQDTRKVFYNVCFYFFGTCRYLLRQCSEITANSCRKSISHSYMFSRYPEIANEIRCHCSSLNHNGMPSVTTLTFFETEHTDKSA
jgi:hypothetical protein